MSAFSALVSVLRMLTLHPILKLTVHHLKLSDGSVVLILTHSSQDLLCIVIGNDCYQFPLDGDIERVKPKIEGVMEVSK